ncbi:MAG: thioredoxin domain-containing protein [Anaerolineales bacterium]|nr:MAG: thioredoxin domain-containing protein [Anaerolineales bacterium]
MPNKLAGESSRYLQQHAENPVNWYPWGDEALARARAEDKPIFLSIGYSACHWCHVMAHESFENESTAEFLNRHFISIKVDREERPDVDRLYMHAVQAMTGGGGWPMSVFITSEGMPFYGGTYFPARPGHGLPSFMQLLQSINNAWNKEREDLLEGGQEVVEMLEQEYQGDVVTDSSPLDTGVIDSALKIIVKSFDSAHGGWGGAPKFPQPMALEFLLLRYHATGDPGILSMVTQTLEAMAYGGLYDQLGGGFHRYTVDTHWLVPHFEKMLYDNAQLVRVYLHAWQVTGNPLFRGIVEETLDYVIREMTSPEGGFYATQDADSEGAEGKFFLWTPEQVRDVLGGPSTHFLELYGITEQGNFEGKTILTFNGSRDAAQAYGERDAISGARKLLFAAREKRVHPGRDEKIITSWNGLMLAGFAEAASVLDREDYRQIAERNAAFLLRALRTGQGRLWHVWNAGRAQGEGILEDYTHLTEGLLTLYQTTFELRWYTAAKELADAVLRHFLMDPKQLSTEKKNLPGDTNPAIYFAGFYDTADDGGELILRPRELQDNAVPSGNGMAVKVLLMLGRFGAGTATQQTDFAEVAQRSLASMNEMLEKYPLAFGQWLVALDSALAVPVEVAIVGAPDGADTRALLDVAQTGYHPYRLVAVGAGDVPPLLAYREPVDGKATAYVCKNHVCRAPVTTPAELRKLLE